MTSLLETNNTYTKIPLMKEKDFHSNMGKSGSNCNYGEESDWKGSSHPSEGYVYPKVTLYNYEEIIDGDIDPSDTGVNSTIIDPQYSVSTGMFCEKYPAFASFVKDNSNSRIYPLGSDINGYFLKDFYSSVGLQYKTGRIAHPIYNGKHLSKDCPNFYDGVRSWRDSSSETNLKILEASNIRFNHCSYKEKSPYLFIDKGLLSIDVKRKADGTMDTNYYSTVNEAIVCSNFSPSRESGYICFSILVKGNIGDVLTYPYIGEESNLTIDKKEFYISNGRASEEGITVPSKWERIHFLVHYKAVDKNSSKSVTLGLRIPVYNDGNNNLSKGISFCEGMISETSYPLVWSYRMRESTLPTSKALINFDLTPNGSSYDKDVSYLSTKAWTISYKRKLCAGISSITDVIGRLAISTSFTPNSGKIQISSLDNGTKSNNFSYELDYSKSPVETIYLSYNGSGVLKYSLYVGYTLVNEFSQNISTFGNCLYSIFLEETDEEGNIITKDKSGKDIEPIRMNTVLGGEFTNISNNKVKDTDFDVSLCESAYSDFIFLEGIALTEENIDKIQKGFMSVKDTSTSPSPFRICYEYSIFEENSIEGSDSKTLSYVGMLQDNSPTNTVVMFADNFTER